MSQQERARDEFLGHIRANMDSVRFILDCDPVEVRSQAAEHGMEMTPEECANLISLLRTGYDVLHGDQWQW